MLRVVGFCLQSIMAVSRMDATQIGSNIVNQFMAIKFANYCLFFSVGLLQSVRTLGSFASWNLHASQSINVSRYQVYRGRPMIQCDHRICYTLQEYSSCCIDWWTFASGPADLEYPIGNREKKTNESINAFFFFDKIFSFDIEATAKTTTLTMQLFKRMVSFIGIPFDLIFICFELKTLKISVGSFLFTAKILAKFQFLWIFRIF